MRHSVLVFGASMSANVLNYAFNFALSRRLGVDGFATLSSLVSFIMIFSIPASVLTLVIVKYAATFHAAGDARRIRRLSQVLLRWTSVAAAVAFIAGILLRGDVGAFLRIQPDASVPLCIAILALSFITPSVRAILQGEQDFVRYSISTVLEVLLKVIAAVALVYAGFGVAGAMFGWAIGTSCALTYTIWAVMRKHGAVADRSIRLGLDTRRLLQTTLGVGLATGFLIVLSFVDVLLVKHYFEPHEAGLYAAVNLTGKIVLFLTGFSPAVLLPKAVARSQNGQSPLPLLFVATIVTCGLSAAVLTVFALLPAQVLAIVAGHAFLSAAPFVFQYDLAMALLAIVTLIVNYKIAVHRFDFLYGLGSVLALDIFAVSMYHRSLWDIIHILLFGNVLAIFACSWQLTGKKCGAAALPNEEAA